MNATVEQARLGLRHFFEGLDGDLRSAYARERDHSHVVLAGHPFGLEMILPRYRQWHQTVCLVAFPGYTDLSVRGMLLMLQEQLKRYSPEQSADQPFRMRIIRVKQLFSTAAEKKHNLYFELITPGYTFLAGGCNDYSGEGGSGGRQLATVFALVNFVYGVPVEEVTVSAEHGEVVEQALVDAYNQAVSERRAS